MLTFRKFNIHIYSDTGPHSQSSYGGDKPAIHVIQ